MENGAVIFDLERFDFGEILIWKILFCPSGEILFWGDLFFTFF